MAHTETGSSRGRRVNVELNLVPVIDLMSVLITFLLLTAVWTQVSMMQIGSSQYSKKDPNEDPKPPPPLADLVLKLEVKTGGYVLTIGKQVISLPLVNGAFDDATLVTQLQNIKTQYPEKKDAVLALDDTLKYENLIQAMDDFLTTGFPIISVATGGTKSGNL